jgi:hypothetical protein
MRSRLVEHEPAAGHLGLAHRLGSVDAPEGRRAIDEVVRSSTTRQRPTEPTAAERSAAVGSPQYSGLVGLRVDRLEGDPPREVDLGLAIASARKS